MWAPALLHTFGFDPLPYERLDPSSHPFRFRQAAHLSICAWTRYRERHAATMDASHASGLRYSLLSTLALGKFLLRGLALVLRLKA